ncbi:5'/3'-nucleotidase SurE [Cucumis melo var. makuwa]|uniref:5'/3'-nucleotidase SurE n=1 Tax=Cucumis melo var. makuwa TaxID=1194695 RepID=A0A5A7SZI5_CUCMM|nr:5'/3'-nucleotidase SurE [Cucumis melo var. makuwa]
MTSSTSVKKNFLPPGLVSNLEDVLRSRKGPGERGEESKDVNNASPHPSSSTSDANLEVSATQKPVILVTNSEGIDSLVDWICLFSMFIACYSDYYFFWDKSVSSHSVTLRETVAVSSAEINGVTAYEVSGTPVDCVSLALSGALFSWSKPLLVISGINRGSSCGHQMFYSGVVAGAREALICGVPSISISLNWKKDQSQESDFKDAVSICLPLINAAISDIEKGNFPKSCSLNVDIPTSPMTNKGFKSTKQSLWRSTLNWQAVSANRYPAGHFMSNQQSLGLQLAQLGRDASAAGAARRLTTQRQNMVEIETTGAVGKSDSERVKKFFRMEFLDKEQDHKDDDLDFTALENGFVAITPFSLTPNIDLDIQTAASDWISTALHQAQ